MCITQTNGVDEEPTHWHSNGGRFMIDHILTPMDRPIRSVTVGWRFVAATIRPRLSSATRHLGDCPLDDRHLRPLADHRK